MKTLFTIVILLALAGCATDSGDANKDRAGRVTNAALSIIGQAVATTLVSTITNASTGERDGDKVNHAHSAVQGLYANLGASVNSNNIAKIINAWSGNELTPVAEVAKVKVAEVEANVGPLTAPESRSIVGTIASAMAAKIK